MNDWLKQNWFKILIVVAIFVYLGILSFEQYVAVKKYNNDILRYAISNCLKDDYSKETTQSCIDRFKKDYINLFKPK